MYVRQISFAHTPLMAAKEKGVLLCLSHSGPSALLRKSRRHTIPTRPLFENLLVQKFHTEF